MHQCRRSSGREGTLAFHPIIVLPQKLPDVVFSQDTFSATNLDKLRLDLENNVPDSVFTLHKINISGSDFVSIFVNSAKFTIESVAKESERVLQYRRKTTMDFFDENRAVFLLAQSKTSGNKILLASFHAKKNKVTDIKREGLIIDFLTYLEDLAKMVGTSNILVGTDINHQMKKFEARTKNRTFCVEVFHYEFHETCKRKGKHVIDFFLHSPRVIPEEAKPCIFHEDIDILDHHPIHSVFLLTEAGSISEPETVSTSTPAPGPALPTQATATSSAKIPALQGPVKRNPSSRLKSLLSDSAFLQDPYQAIGFVVPQASLNSSGANSKGSHPSLIQTGPQTTHDNWSYTFLPNSKYHNQYKDDKLLQPQALLRNQNQQDNTQNQHQIQIHHQSHQQDQIQLSFLREGPQNPQNLSDLQNIQTGPVGAEGMAAARAGRKFGVERAAVGAGAEAVNSTEIFGASAVPPGAVGGGWVRAGQGAWAGDQVGKPKSPPNFTGNSRAFSTDTVFTQERVSFACELCKRNFETQHGIFIHFGKVKESHHPCKQKFEDEKDINKKFCLRVFRTEAGMKQHRTKQGNNPRHHHPGQPFPNLNIV